MAALLVEASILGHNGEESGAVNSRFGRRAVGGRGVIGHGAGGGCQVCCRLVLIHVSAAGVGCGLVWGRIHVVDIRLAVRHGAVSCVDAGWCW